MITEVEEEDTHTEKDRKNKKRTCWWRVLLEQLPTRWDAATRKRCHFGARLPAFRFPALSTDWFPLLILGVDTVSCSLFCLVLFLKNFFPLLYPSFSLFFLVCLTFCRSFMSRCRCPGLFGFRCHFTFPGFSIDWLIVSSYLFAIHSIWIVSLFLSQFIFVLLFCFVWVIWTIGWLLFHAEFSMLNIHQEPSFSEPFPKFKDQVSRAKRFSLPPPPWSC